MKSLWARRFLLAFCFFFIPLTAGFCERAPFLLKSGPTKVESLPLPQPSFTTAWKSIYEVFDVQIAVYLIKAPWFSPGPVSRIDNDLGLTRLQSADPPIFQIKNLEGTFIVIFSTSEVPWQDFIPDFIKGYRYFQKLPQYRNTVIFPSQVPHPNLSN